MASMKLGQILMEWSFNKEDYEISYKLYMLGVGIPTKFLYKTPNKRIFNSSKEFLHTHDVKKTYNDDLNKIFRLFKESSYCRLEEWGNLYGYKLKYN